MKLGNTEKLGILLKEISAFEELLLFSKVKTSCFVYLIKQSPNWKRSFWTLICGQTVTAFNWKIMGSSSSTFIKTLYSWIF